MTMTRKKYTLSAEACDAVAGDIMDFCRRAGVNRKDALRCRLSAEDCLTHWQKRLGEDAEVTLQMGRRFGSPLVILRAEGPKADPFAAADEAYGEYCQSVLVRMNLKPEYSYAGGANRIMFRLPRKALNPLITLALALAAAAVVGLLGMLLPQTVREGLAEGLLDPLYSTFFRGLSCVAGPMIFLSVAWGIYGIGDVETLGRIGKRLVLRDLGTVGLACALSAACFPLFGLNLSIHGGFHGHLADVTEMVFGVVPSSVIEPFLSGNTLQIIFLAAVVGVAMVYLSQRTRAVAHAVEQANQMVSFLMGFISRLVPGVIFLVAVRTVWSGTLARLSGVWRFVLVFVAAAAVLTAAHLLLTAWRRGVSPLILVRKLSGVFMIALTTASSAATLGTSLETCQNRLGVDASLTGFGLPLGQVIHKAAFGVFNLLLVFFFAERYGVPCSPVWLVMAVFVSAVMAVAAPPVPGGGVAVFAMLLSQMSIPSEALATALALDVALDFFTTAMDQVAVALTLVDAAAGLGMIDLATLRAGETAS